DRLGGEHYTVDGMKAEGDKVVEETRKNLIPLSRQYMTLAEAQADIANIPSGSATYVRSTDGSSLADEYINNAGTLQPTGRKMPSYDSIKNLIGLNENTRFIFPEDGEYEFGIPFDVLLEDAEHNIIYTLNGNKFKFYGDVEFDSVETG
ncbi:hypothetical protein ACOIHU_25850, partial [Klebsiella pneumoniae]